jgi:hypothetical protein
LEILLQSNRLLYREFINFLARYYPPLVVRSSEINVSKVPKESVRRRWRRRRRRRRRGGPCFSK